MKAAAASDMANTRPNPDRLPKRDMNPMPDVGLFSALVGAVMEIQIAVGFEVSDTNPIRRNIPPNGSISALFSAGDRNVQKTNFFSQRISI